MECSSTDCLVLLPEDKHPNRKYCGDCAGLAAIASNRISSMRLYAKRDGYAPPVLTISEFIPLLRRTVCAACGSQDRALHLDHCHETGEVRGMVCIHCNIALGHVSDSVAVLEKLINYLSNT